MELDTLSILFTDESFVVEELGLLGEGTFGRVASQSTPVLYVCALKKIKQSPETIYFDVWLIHNEIIEIMKSLDHLCTFSSNLLCTNTSLTHFVLVLELSQGSVYCRQCHARLAGGPYCNNKMAHMLPCANCRGPDLLFVMKTLSYSLA